MHLYHAFLCGSMSEITSIQRQCGYKCEGDDKPGHSSNDDDMQYFVHHTPIVP